MARFSFGGAQDLSAIFADMYRVGEAQAARERNAADENIINRWETGDMSDKEFYAYARRRIEESADDPEEKSQWQQILRNARQTNEGEVIEDNAEDIMDGIEDGTKTWDDLLRYYKQQKRKLRPSDPLYRELEKQMDEVEDRKRDNEVASTYGSIDYRYRSGQISGAQAEKEMKALAERYRTNDPQKYYELLGQGLDYRLTDEAAAAQAASGGSGGSRSSGGSSRSSGGSSGSDDSLKDTIDELKGFEDRLLSLSRQAKDGQRIGSITVPGEDGIPVSEQLRLLNADGTVTPELRALHEQTLMVYDELEAALIADGKAGEAGTIAGRRATFITDYVQPANTISKERQWGRMVDDFVSTVNAANGAASPMLAWRDIQKQAQRLALWGSRLNTRTTSTDVEKRASDEMVRENPELAAAVRRQTTSEEGDVLRRLAPTFTDEVLPQIEAIMAAVAAEDPAAIAAAFANLPEGSPLADAAEGLAQNRRVVQGLADGSFQMVMTPNGIQMLEVIREQTGIGQDGNPSMQIAALANAAGDVVWQFDPNVDGPMTEIIARVGSEYMPVMAMTQQQSVLMDDFTWDGVTYRRGTVLPDEVIEAIEDAPEGTPPPPVGNMRVTQAEGKTWYGMEMPDGSTGWYANRVPRNTNIPALPAPYTGPAENAQSAFVRLGLDPTGRAVLDNAVATGNRVGMRAYDRLQPGANVQRATADTGYRQPSAPEIVDPGQRIGTGSYTPRQSMVGMNVPGSRTGAMARSLAVPRPTLTMSQTLAAVRGDTDPISNIRSIGQSLGLRGLGERPQRGMAAASLGRVRPIDVVRPTIRSVARPNIQVVRPNVDVAGLRNMSARLQAMRTSWGQTSRSFSLRSIQQLRDARNDGGWV